MQAQLTVVRFWSSFGLDGLSRLSQTERIFQDQAQVSGCELDSKAKLSETKRGKSERLGL